MITPCLSTPAESTPGSFPVKILSVKSLPCEKRLHFLPSDNITQFSSPRGKYRIIDSPQWIFECYPDKLWYYPCNIAQFLVCGNVSSGSRQSVVTFPEILG